MTIFRKPLASCLATGFTLLLGLVLGEAMLRVLGFHPWKPAPDLTRPIIAEPDPILGWRNKPGHFQIRSFDPKGEELEVNIWPGGRRATAAREVRLRPVLAVVGCSFTFGWAVSDSQTYGWKLQGKYPRVQVDNYGTPGYSTYQSLLALERTFAGTNPPAAVIHGFIEGHEVRNAAASYWLRQLAILSRGTVSVPHCSIGAAGKLERHPPESQQTLPLHRYFSVVDLAERVYMKWKSRKRVAQMRPITEKLLVEMNQLCRSKGVPFLLVLLSASAEAKAHYLRFCESQQIPALDGVEPLTDALTVTGDGHPNEKLHQRWADAIAGRMDGLLQRLSFAESTAAPPVR